MKNESFIHHRLNSRKNLLEFIREITGVDVCLEIGKDPGKWIQELSIVNQLLTGMGLGGVTGLDMPPVGNPEFNDLGKDSFLYLGAKDRLKGLWIKKDLGLEGLRGTSQEWTQYRLGTRAHLWINPRYGDISPEELLPERIELEGTRVRSQKGETKRPIWRTRIKRDCGNLEIYAKGADTSASFLVDPPYFRLTSIAGISRTDSEREMETTLTLRDLGVNVPDVVGYYKSDFEQFLFLRAIEGDSPDKWLPKFKNKIIEQDARMLALMFLGGYTKNGFGDYDDKIFDGNKLWLIDVDECKDLYFTMAPDFRGILLNSKDPRLYPRFRKTQRRFLQRWLKDTIYDYQQSLLPLQEDKERYTKVFFKTMGWEKPGDRELNRLLTFERNYQTIEGYVGMMQDVD